MDNKQTTLSDSIFIPNGAKFDIEVKGEGEMNNLGGYYPASDGGEISLREDLFDFKSLNARFRGAALFEEMFHALQFKTYGSTEFYSRSPTNREFEAKFFLDFLAYKNFLSGITSRVAFLNYTNLPSNEKKLNEYNLAFMEFKKEVSALQGASFTFEQIKQKYFDFNTKFKTINSNNAYGNGNVMQDKTPSVGFNLIKTPCN